MPRSRWRGRGWTGIWIWAAFVLPPWSSRPMVPRVGSAVEEFRCDLGDHVLRAAGVVAGEFVEQAKVEVGLHRRPAGEPVEFAARDGQGVGGGGQSEDLVASGLRGWFCEERHLELALGLREDLGREWLEGRDGANLRGGADEAPDLEAEPLRQGLIHAALQSGCRGALGVEDQVAARAEVDDVGEAAVVEAFGELLAARPAPADVDCSQERDVARHARIVITAARSRRLAWRRSAEAAAVQRRGGRKACRDE